MTPASYLSITDTTVMVITCDVMTNRVTE